MGKNKDRLNQKSIPWADSILEQVINLPAAGGEDLQSTAEAQTLAVENLLKMVNRKVAENRGEGQYVWKKYGDEVLSFNQLTTNTNPTIVQVTSKFTDLSTVDSSFFAGLSGKYSINGYGSYSYEFTDTTLTYNGVTVTYTYDPTTAQIKIKASLTDRQWGSIEIPAFVGYVVADSEDAYSEGHVKFDSATLIPENIREGVDIWGVIGTMSEGVSGIDFGKVTLSSATDSVTVSHSLNATPKAGIMVYGQKNGDVDVGSSNKIDMSMWGSTYMHNSAINWSLYGSGQFSATNKDVTFPAGPLENWGAGPYTWIVFL